MRDLSRLLDPRSIAVIGASDQPGNLGGTAMRLLRKFGYAGRVMPVNPRRAEVGGLACFPSVADLPEPAELALITTAAPSVAGLVRDCAAAGISHGIAWAGGFAEVGAEGATLQQQLADACVETGFTLAGPNCIGIVNSHARMTGTFASFLVETDELVPGDISMVSQSGGLATMCQAMAQQAGFGFRLMISSGNEVVLSVADYVHALAADAATRVIALYLEGVRDGPLLLAALEAARRAGKPVVVLKGGATPASVAAVAAHTGALAGEGRVWEAVLREVGAVQVEGLEELLDTALFLATLPAGRSAAGSRIAIVTTGGGSGVITADQCARQGLQTPPPSPGTHARLRALAPPLAAIGNPIDLTPQVYTQPESFQRFGATLDAIAADPGIDSVFVQFGPMAQRGLEVAAEVASFHARCPKPVAVAWMLAPPGAVPALRAARVPVFGEYRRTVAMLAALARARPSSPPVLPDARYRWQDALPAPAAGLVVSEPECHRILATFGLPVAPGKLVATAAQAVAAAQAIGLPVVMKGIAAAVTHRAAAGLVALDLRDDEELHRAAETLIRRAATIGIALEGIYVQRMAKGGAELLVSALRDPTFGPVVSVGAGGTMTETIDDIALARAPLDEAGAAALLARLRMMPAAMRLSPEADPAALARFVADFSQLAAAAPWRRFTLELNPVKWSAAGIVAVDGLILVQEP